MNTCKSRGVTILMIAIIISFVPNSHQSSCEIKQVNVLFRHGDRTSDKLYPLLPYSHKEFYPYGAGALTNSGKNRAYHFGTILRKKYNDFLGTTYLTEDVQALSSNYDRTKMTLQLVLAGLYPPNRLQKWNADLNWQPIPTNYNLQTQDYIFQRRHICPGYLAEREKILRNPKIAQKISTFDNLMKKLTLLTGKNMTDIEDLYLLYANFVALEAMGLELPNWSKGIFPQGQLFDAMLLSLEIQNYNNVMKRLNGGGILRQILENMMQLKKDSGETPKINLYSGHDVNVLALLLSLNLAKPHLPAFGGAVIMELLSMNDDYYVKIWYYLWIPAEMKEMKIPDCSTPCPLDRLLNLTQSVIPSDEEFKCVQDTNAKRVH